jgi:hypothetical protein
VFTARYALSPYIKQIRFVFKGLNWNCMSKRITSSVQTKVLRSQRVCIVECNLSVRIKYDIYVYVNLLLYFDLKNSFFKFVEKF